MSAPTQTPKSFYGISLHVTIVVAPENADKFPNLLKPVFDAVTAEPENLFFEVFQDPEQPGYFRFVENWSMDKDWLINVQLTKDYYKPYLEATEPLWIEPRQFQILERMPTGWMKAKTEYLKGGVV